MKWVGVKALKNELSRYHAVRQGELVLVLDHDEVIAEIRRPPHSGRGLAPPPWEAFVATLEAEGGLRAARGPTRSMRGDLEAGVFPAVADAGRLVAEARRDRE